MIDVVTFLVLVLALVKGIRNGLVMAIFSFAGLLLGLLAAMKLSTILVSWMADSVTISPGWLPFIAFVLVFLAVAIGVGLVGKLLESTAEWASLGWLNKGAGVVFYSLIYLICWSMLLYYLEKLHLLRQQAMDSSVTYTILAPWGPEALDLAGRVFPFFKDILAEVSTYLDQLSQPAELPPA